MRQIGIPQCNQSVVKQLMMCHGKYHTPLDMTLLRQKGLRMACSASSSDDKAAGQSVTMNASVAGHQRYAVIGGGFAGVAVAWHLLVQHHNLYQSSLPPSACARRDEPAH